MAKERSPKESPARPGRLAPGEVEEIPVPPGLPQPPPGVEQLPRVEIDGVVYLSPHAIVARWGHTVRLKTLKNRRSLGQGPRFVRIGRAVYYPLEDVRAYERKVMKIRSPDDDAPATSSAPTGRS